jgi:hypothetical protein
MQEHIQRIAAKIQARGIKLGPKMTHAKVCAFEDQYTIKFPEEYREFLLRIGNGAPGPPAYGLIPLAEPPAGAADFRSHTREKLVNMRNEFPFTKAWVWEAGDICEEGADDQLGNGQLYLGTDGCGMDWHLIITGPERGSVWFISGEGITPTSPRRDFLKWFEDWLDGVRDWWIDSK